MKIVIMHKQRINSFGEMLYSHLHRMNHIFSSGGRRTSAILCAFKHATSGFRVLFWNFVSCLRRKNFSPLTKCISQALGCTYQSMEYMYQIMGYTSQDLGYKPYNTEKRVFSLFWKSLRTMGEMFHNQGCECLCIPQVPYTSCPLFWHHFLTPLWRYNVDNGDKTA